MRARHVILILSIALLASFSGAIAFRFLLLDRTPSAAESFAIAQRETRDDLVGSRRPDYTLGSITGERVSAADFDGRVVLVNFWATWCKPCREEMPMLASLYSEYAEQGFEVVGIALDDVQPAKDFAQELGIDYSVLVGSTDVMAVIRVYGNLSGVLPYSVLIDRNGLINWVQLGALSEQDLVSRIGPLLRL